MLIFHLIYEIRNKYINLLIDYKSISDFDVKYVSNISKD